MISYLLFGSSKLLNISDITKRIGNFFKLLILLFYTITYPELAFIVQGFMLDNWPLVITNLITATCSAIVFGIKIHNDYFRNE